MIFVIIFDRPPSPGSLSASHCNKQEHTDSNRGRIKFNYENHSCLSRAVLNDYLVCSCRV